MHITGKTESGQNVVGGLFKFYDTYGLPLTVLFDQLQENNSVMDVIGFYNDAKKAGWKDVKILAQLSEHLADSYGNQYRDVVISKLKEYIE